MSSMPQFLKFPVEERSEFRQFWRERMQPDLDLRIGPNWQEDLQQWKKEPQPFGVISDRWGGSFGPLRNLLGVQKLCTLFYNDPAFVEEMMEANADFIISMMSQVLDVIEMPLHEAIKKIEDGTIRDAKTIVGLYAVYVKERAR